MHSGTTLKMSTEIDKIARNQQGFFYYTCPRSGDTLQQMGAALALLWRSAPLGGVHNPLRPTICHIWELKLRDEFENSAFVQAHATDLFRTCLAAAA